MSWIIAYCSPIVLRYRRPLLNFPQPCFKKETEHEFVLFPQSTLTFLKLVSTLTHLSSHALKCIDSLQDLMAESIFMSHVPLSELPSGPPHSRPNTAGISALLAPATVVIQLYFPTSICESDKHAAEASIRGVIERYICYPHDVDGNGRVAMGWSVENDVPVMSAERKLRTETQQQDDGSTAAVYGVLAGWESEKAAEQWRRGSEGIEFLTRVNCLPGVRAVKVETVELRCHHNLARGNDRG